MSSQSSDDIKNAANQIDSSVSRLESLFDKLYSDTFAMMKDTVTDMRKHIWRSPYKEENEIDEKVKMEFSAKIEEILKQQAGTETKVDKLAEDLSGLLESALKESSETKKSLKRDEMKQAVLEAIDTLGSPTLQTIATYLGVKDDDLIDPIFTLANEKTITWPGAPSRLGGTDIIKRVELDDKEAKHNKTNSADAKKRRG